MKIKELSKNLSKTLGPVPCNNGKEEEVKKRQDSEVSKYVKQEEKNKQTFDNWSNDKNDNSDVYQDVQDDPS